MDKEKYLLSGISLVIFDMDGTLYRLDGPEGKFHGSSLQRAVYANTISFIQSQESCTQEQALSVLEEAKLNGIGISAALASKYGITRDQYFDRAWDIEPKGIVCDWEKSTQVIQQIMVPTILLTAAPRAWQKNACGFMGLEANKFVEIYTGEMFNTKSDIFEQIAKKYIPSRVLSVGDQEDTDIIPARDLGMNTLLVKHPQDLEILLS